MTTIAPVAPMAPAIAFRAAVIAEREASATLTIGNPLSRARAIAGQSLALALTRAMGLTDNWTAYGIMGDLARVAGTPAETAVWTRMRLILTGHAAQ